MTGLAQLIAESRWPEIPRHLDGLEHEARVRALRSLRRGEQRSLYELAAAAPPLDLEFFVPPGTPARTEVIHAGTNTLPVPRPLRRFEKRFARPDGDGERLFGYNVGRPWRWLGPGYFVAEATRGNEGWEQRGAVVVDYFQIPDSEVPDGWPRVIPNSSGLQRFVYRGTRDFMRRVSADVSIGAAFRGEQPLDHYFTLCRASG